MKCPWLKTTIIETNNRNSFNDSRRSEREQFSDCMKIDCPFYHPQVEADNGEIVFTETCLRVSQGK